MSNREEKQKKLISYLIWSGICLALVIFCFFVSEKPHLESSAAEVIGKIGNCFVVPGVVFGGIGALSYLAHLGAYDGLAYSFSSFGLHNLWTRRQPKKYKSLYEYKQQKDAKGRKWLPHTLLIGVVSLGVGLVMTMVYIFMAF